MAYKWARIPNERELAYAVSYIMNEYRTRTDAAGCILIDGEQWAEGLAFGRQSGELLSEDIHTARAARAQLTDQQWVMIAERANYIAREQSEPARY